MKEAAKKRAGRTRKTKEIMKQKERIENIILIL